MTYPASSTSRPDLAYGELQLRTGAWYGDRVLALPIPQSWNVELFSPQVGPPLRDDQIAERLELPVGQPAIRELCRGRARPLVIVDDLNRPTPASRVLPALLRQFEGAGIAAQDVGIIMAPGTHGAPPPDALIKKVGREAASVCRLYVHDCNRGTVKIGRTSFGTPVLVNKHVLESDFLVGVGGVYPNQTAGFGGGSKLALGVLGFRSIAGLHYGHQSMGWGTPNSVSNFRRDLDEIAQLIKLRTTVSLLLNSDRDVVDLRSGDHRVYYQEFLDSAREEFRAPRPDDRTDLVIANAYPGDLSLTFVRMKGLAPLKAAPPGASRIVIAPCVEGLGFHGLYPFMNAPRNHRVRTLGIRASILFDNPRQQGRKVGKRIARKLRSLRQAAQVAPDRDNPIWLYRPFIAEAAGLPDAIPGMRVTCSWDEIVEGVTREQAGRTALRANIYTCSALQGLG